MEGFLLKYEGGDTDHHIIDAIQYSDSLKGSGRLYVSVAHFCTYGEVLKPRQRSDIRCYASEGKSGCYETAVIIASQIVQLPLFSEVYKPYLDWLIGKITEYIKDRLTGRGSMEKLAEEIAKQAERSAELNNILANGLLKSNDNMAEIARDSLSIQKALIEKLPPLVDANSRNMVMAVSPIGRSCREIRHFAGSESEFYISEPEADAIRSKEELEVDDMKEYECDLISELNTKSGHCHLHLVGDSRHIVGKISDPALSVPDNIYSRALNSQTGFKFTAKAVLKDGEIQRLYVSDAKGT